MTLMTVMILNLDLGLKDKHFASFGSSLGPGPFPMTNRPKNLVPLGDPEERAERRLWVPKPLETAATCDMLRLSLSSRTSVIHGIFSWINGRGFLKFLAESGKIRTVSSAKSTKNNGTSQFLMGKSTISMAIFNSKLLNYRRVSMDHWIGLRFFFQEQIRYSIVNTMVSGYLLVI